MTTKTFPLRELCKISIFAAIIAICAQISIPMPYGVPMTLQTFAIPLAGVVLGAKNGTISTLIYILLGFIGLPVFAGFTGGIGIVFGRTGGFILAFPFMALAAGIGASFNHQSKSPASKGRKKQKLAWLLLWLVIGAIFLYTSGLLAFSFVTSIPLRASFGLVVAPFIPTEIIKIILVVTLGSLLKQRLSCIAN